jgi:hypothetical protein
MTRAEYEMLRLDSETTATEKEVSGSLVWMRRMTNELVAAVESGFDHECQTQNLTSAVANAAIVAAKLRGLRNAKKMMAAMADG